MCVCLDLWGGGSPSRARFDRRIPHPPPPSSVLQLQVQCNVTGLGASTNPSNWGVLVSSERMWPLGCPAKTLNSPQPQQPALNSLSPAPSCLQLQPCSDSGCSNLQSSYSDSLPTCGLAVDSDCWLPTPRVSTSVSPPTYVATFDYRQGLRAPGGGVCCHVCGRGAVVEVLAWPCPECGAPVLTSLSCSRPCLQPCQQPDRQHLLLPQLLLH